MDSKQRRPQHASYRLHRRQVAWQIILPVVLAGLCLVAVGVLVSMSVAAGNGEVSRWADVSAMWLSIPVMIGALVMLAIVIALAWAVGKGAGFIPPYSHKAQVFVSEVEKRVKEGAAYAYHPRSILSQIGHLIRNRIRGMRGQ
jgi:F0F1-type ATP synthase membrane subunit c/vacuolar-type H+-ATPase subunit K